MLHSDCAVTLGPLRRRIGRLGAACDAAVTAVIRSGDEADNAVADLQLKLRDGMNTR